VSRKSENDAIAECRAAAGSFGSRRWNGGRSVSYHELGGEGVEAAAAGREADAGEEVEIAELRAEVRRHVLLDAQLAGCSNSTTTVITVFKVFFPSVLSFSNSNP
jgi:hypothetical protein